MLNDWPASNLQLTNMQLAVNVRLYATHDPSGQPGVGAADVNGVFTFDGNLENFPDWLVSPFIDVENTIKVMVGDRVHRAFLDLDRRAALAMALTKAINAFAHSQNSQFTGFHSIDNLWVIGDTLLIDYTAN